MGDVSLCYSIIVDDLRELLAGDEDPYDLEDLLLPTIAEQAGGVLGGRKAGPVAVSNRGRGERGVTAIAINAPKAPILAALEALMNGWLTASGEQIPPYFFSIGKVATAAAKDFNTICLPVFGLKDSLPLPTLSTLPSTDYCAQLPSAEALAALLSQNPRLLVSLRSALRLLGFRAAEVLAHVIGSSRFRTAEVIHKKNFKVVLSDGLGTMTEGAVLGGSGVSIGSQGGGFVFERGGGGGGVAGEVNIGARCYLPSVEAAGALLVEGGKVFEWEVSGLCCPAPVDVSESTQDHALDLLVLGKLRVKRKLPPGRSLLRLTKEKHPKSVGPWLPGVRRDVSW